MSIPNVRSALVTAFVGGSFFAANKVAYQNQIFTPPSDAWASVFFLPAQPEVATLGTAGQDELTGVMQVDLNYPLNSGEIEINTKAKAIRDLFKAGAGFTYLGTTTFIRSCGQSPGRNVDGFYRISVSIFFYAYINR